MRRLIGLSCAPVLAFALLLPAAAPVAAENPGCGSSFFFSSTVSFAPGYWSPGTHRVDWSWSVYGTGDGSFVVDTRAPLYAGHVWIFPFGGAGLVAGPDFTFIDAVNPAQPTIFWDEYGFSGDVADIVAVHNSTQEFVSFDGAPPIATHFSGLGSTCQTGGPYKVTSQFTRSLGPRLH